MNIINDLGQEILKHKNIKYNILKIIWEQNNIKLILNA